MPEPDNLNNRFPNAFPWKRTIIGLIITGLALWFLSHDIQWADLRSAIQSARKDMIAWAVVVIVITGLLKGWRWQLLYYPIRPSFLSVYRALMLGQMLNLISPIPRLGDLYRISQIHRGTQMTRAETVGTLVSEKSFDILITALMVLILIPFFAVPDFIQNRVITVALLAFGLIAALYLLVFQAEGILKLTGWFVSWLPEMISSRLLNLAERILMGLSALRNLRITSILILQSVAIGILSMLTPLLLFWAFDLTAYGVVEAVLMNTASILSLSVPSAPGKIGTFESVAVAMLAYFGIADDSLRLGYAILYHLVVFIPPILIGGYAALSGGLNLRDSFRPVSQLPVTSDQ